MKQKNKKKVYIALSILLGVLLSFIAHALAEVWIIQKAFAEGASIKGTYFLGVGWCALPVWSQYSFLILGVVGGYYLGQYWWKVVYINPVK